MCMSSEGRSYEGPVFNPQQQKNKNKFKTKIVIIFHNATGNNDSL